MLKHILDGEKRNDGLWQRMERGEMLPAEFGREFSKQVSQAVSTRGCAWVSEVCVHGGRSRTW